MASKHLLRLIYMTCIFMIASATKLDRRDDCIPAEIINSLNGKKEIICVDENIGTNILTQMYNS
ncbi:hypothetical protein K7432_000743 [Basidiobolus ranarum]|uniref:Uncharacterized protein n=1 Tax=Basidiobolus ranarum TaxID=34480 RepID=A0ABR2X478_9FUNG